MVNSKSWLKFYLNSELTKTNNWRRKMSSSLKLCARINKRCLITCNLLLKSLRPFIHQENFAYNARLSISHSSFLSLHCTSLPVLPYAAFLCRSTNSLIMFRDILIRYGFWNSLLGFCSVFNKFRISITFAFIMVAPGDDGIYFSNKINLSIVRYRLGKRQGMRAT